MIVEVLKKGIYMPLNYEWQIFVQTSIGIDWVMLSHFYEKMERFIEVSKIQLYAMEKQLTERYGFDFTKTIKIVQSEGDMTNPLSPELYARVMHDLDKIVWDNSGKINYPLKQEKMTFGEEVGYLFSSALNMEIF